MLTRLTVLILSIVLYSFFYVLTAPGWFYIKDTPLACAIKQNDPHTFNSLLETEDFEIKDGSGNTPLSIAVDEVNYNFTKELLEKGANPNARSDFADRPIICEAASRVCYPRFNRSKDTARDIVKLLIKYGADVNARTILGETAILRAARCGDAKLSTILIKNGANVNIFSRQGVPLHQAIYKSRRSKSYETIEALIAGGANPRVKNYKKDYGKTAIDLAKGYNDLKLLKILEKSNSTASLSSYTSERTTLTYKDRRIESILYRYGIYLPAYKINFITKYPFLFIILMLPTLIACLTGVVKKDVFLITAGALQPHIIVAGFILILFIGDSS
ncbi:MAG: ankyrin repeat domain-containing protein [Proteobacteria bacterium]|nr:ankyrin repeat domain-containing protein [Pseudomonadota bacterium]MBU4010414.1 ankyrin repeat domain-containing protein [Pseudomonadota bacterium]MBU4037649.1 ankyrin repeat domain-containing protein [Pseudomonadota bacterium]